MQNTTTATMMKSMRRKKPFTFTHTTHNENKIVKVNKLQQLIFIKQKE